MSALYGSPRHHTQLRSQANRMLLFRAMDSLDLPWSYSDPKFEDDEFVAAELHRLLDNDPSPIAAPPPLLAEETRQAIRRFRPFRWPVATEFPPRYV